MDLNKTLLTIEAHIHQAETHLAAVKVRMDALNAAGTYPAVPTERWKDDKYLYLYFPQGGEGLKLDAKQRLYIGADPAKIEEARRLVRNREQWEQLNRLHRDLQSWLSSKEREIDRLSREAEGWQRLAGQQLGLEIAGQPGQPSPNGLGPQNAGSPGAASPKADN